MLQYYTKHKIICLVFSFLATFVFYIATCISVGGVVPPTLIGMVTTTVLFLSFLFMTSRIFGRRIDTMVMQMLDTYNRDCDPQRLYDQGAQLAGKIMKGMTKSPRENSTGSWFLSFYALAAADLGRVQEAEDMAKAMVKTAGQQRKPFDQLTVLANLEPLVLRLHGAAAAQAVLDQAEQLLSQVSGPGAEVYGTFVKGEGSTLANMRNGNTQALLDLFERVRRSDDQLMRMRVMYADAAASIYQARGDQVSERACRQFVVSNGNKLPLVPLNAARLEELVQSYNAQPEPSGTAAFAAAPTGTSQDLSADATVPPADPQA